MLLWLQLTSGLGPLECSWVVGKIYEQILRESDKSEIKIKVINSILDVKPKNFKSMLLGCGEKRIFF